MLVNLETRLNTKQCRQKIHVRPGPSVNIQWVNKSVEFNLIVWVVYNLVQLPIYCTCDRVWLCPPLPNCKSSCPISDTTAVTHLTVVWRRVNSSSVTHMHLVTWTLLLHYCRVPPCVCMQCIAFIDMAVIQELLSNLNIHTWDARTEVEHISEHVLAYCTCTVYDAPHATVYTCMWTISVLSIPDEHCPLIFSSPPSPVSNSQSHVHCTTTSLHTTS